MASLFKTPLLRHEWFVACAEAFCPPGKLSVMIGHDQGTIVAIAPLVLNPSFGSARFELLGTAILSEPSGLLYRSSGALNDMLDSILRLRKPIYFKGLFSDSPELRYLRETRRPRLAYSRSLRSASPWIPIETSWEKFSSGISSSWRSNLRRAQRRAEEFGAVQFEFVVPQAESVETLVQEVFHVESAGWKSRTQTALESIASLRKFFIAYTKSAATLGTLRLAFLRIDGKAVAAQLLVEYANRLWVLKVGYDEAYSRCSPGILLMHRVIQKSFEQGHEGFELLGANESWMDIWRPQLHTHETLRRYPISPGPIVSHGLEFSVDVFKRVQTIARKDKNKGVLRSIARKVVSRIRRARQPMEH
ncbi:MAG: GNAT family N-acetyltransferase [Bacteroidota bacterium]